jgi:hypothetical protein
MPAIWRRLSTLNLKWHGWDAPKVRPKQKGSRYERELPITPARPFLALYRDGFHGWAKLVIDVETNTLLGATFVGPQFSELVQAATLAILAKVPVSLLRHAVAPHPTVNQVWDPLLAQETELGPLLESEAPKAQKSA